LLNTILAALEHGLSPPPVKILTGTRRSIAATAHLRA